MTEPLRLAVLVSGRGSNLRAVLDAIAAGRCRAEIVRVIADRVCPALELAEARGIETAIVARRGHPDRPAWDAALAAALDVAAPEWVLLAGFMRLVGESVLARYGGRVLNVHPSLLPAFPGLRAPQQALDAGARITGCTVHLVDRGVDTGPIVAQAAVPIRTDDDPDALHARIQAQEHRLLPAVVNAIATGQLRFDQGPVWTDPQSGSLLALP